MVFPRSSVVSSSDVILASLTVNAFPPLKKISTQSPTLNSFLYFNESFILLTSVTSSDAVSSVLLSEAFESSAH